MPHLRRVSFFSVEIALAGWSSSLELPVSPG